jgi:hypothetical protein
MPVRKNQESHMVRDKKNQETKTTSLVKREPPESLAYLLPKDNKKMAQPPKSKLKKDSLANPVLLVRINPNKKALMAGTSLSLLTITNKKAATK